ncbi:hypothetical protein ACA910_010917 [Epithemia clementina (nom. ined.)]
MLDTGHFLLGEDYLEGVTDSEDPKMSNPNPDVYRTLQAPYPSWCTGGSFVVYRKIQQDVPAFWQTCYEKAKDQVSCEEERKKLAGTYASKMIGRWWDGTPMTFPAPLTGLFYPPTKQNWNNVNVNEAIKLDGLKNGFQFNAAEQPWRLKDGAETVAYDADPNGSACPFAAHIRKVNPRDEFTDIGSGSRTLNHRIIRRGNNYGRRINNVFAPTSAEKEEKRGLSLVMYQVSIENQFEFLQRHWSNSETRPKPGGDDMIIGLGKPEKSITFSPDNSTSIPVTITTATDFTHPVGMDYFILPPIDAITNVITASVIDKEVFYEPPGNKMDFSDFQTRRMWNWTIDTVYWQSIWQSADSTTIANGGQTIIPGFDKYPTGIGYRLPNPEQTAQNYHDISKPTNLQFRSTQDVTAMAAKLASIKKTPISNTLIPATIAWQGFPKRVLDLYRNSNVNPYEIVEQPGWPPKDLTYRSYVPVASARQMDEYCEWYTHRNDDGKITRIDITCESPEYWTFLVKNRPDVAVQLYQKYVNPKVTLDSLLDKDGNYNIYNEWNTEKGAMHLNCPPNSLFAEVYIAAEAATRWADCSSSGTGFDDNSCKLLTSGGDLIGCASYGLSTRASDPTIGKNVNDLIRSGYIISVANPVGLYLEKLDTSGWLNPQGDPFTATQIQEIVQYVRESPDGSKKLRIQIEIPPHLDYVLGDCSIGGAPLDWAGQLIDSSVTVFLNAIAVNGQDPDHRFLFDPSTMDAALVSCKSEWGDKTSDGTVLGPPQNLISPMVVPPPAPEPLK